MLPKFTPEFEHHDAADKFIAILGLFEGGFLIRVAGRFNLKPQWEFEPSCQVSIGELGCQLKQRNIHALHIELNNKIARGQKRIKLV